MRHTEYQVTLAVWEASQGKRGQEHGRQTSKRNGSVSAQKMGILRTPASELEVLLDRLNGRKDLEEKKRQESTGRRSGRKDRLESQSRHAGNAGKRWKNAIS